VTEELKRPVVLAVDDSTDMLALIEKALAMDYEVSPRRIPAAASRRRSASRAPT
jgi:hypothetical protein